MDPSKPNKNSFEKETLSNDEPEGDSTLKLEIWENEGGAIDQSNIDHQSKEE